MLRDADAIRAVDPRICSDLRLQAKQPRRSALYRREHASRLTEAFEMPRIRAQIARITVRNSDDSSLYSKIVSALHRTRRGKLAFQSLADDDGFPLSAFRGGGFNPATKVGSQPDRNSKFLRTVLRYVRHV